MCFPNWPSRHTKQHFHLHKAGAWFQDIIHLIISFFQIIPSLPLNMIPKVTTLSVPPSPSIGTLMHGNVQKTEAYCKCNLEAHSGRDEWLELLPDMNRKGKSFAAGVSLSDLIKWLQWSSNGFWIVIRLMARVGLRDFFLFVFDQELMCKV